MANERTSVELELITLFQKARQDVSKFTNDAQKQLSSINFTSAVTAINQGFELIGRTAGRSFQAVSSVIQESVAEAAKAEQANLKLAQSMKVVGDFSEQALESFRDQADELARLTTLTDDAVISGAALAKSFGLTNSETRKVVAAAADLSAVTGDDLNTSINALAKSYNGFVDKTIAKMIPGLKGLNDTQLEAGRLVEIVGAKFRDTAQTLTQSFSGALEQTKNQFGEVLESLGKIVTTNPVVIQTLKILNEVFRDLQKTIEANTGEVSAFITDIVKGLATMLPAVISTFRAVDKIISTTVLAFVTLGKSIGAVGAALVELASGNFAGIAEINKAVTEENKKLFDDNEKRIEALYGTAEKVAQKISDRVQAIRIDSNRKAVAVEKQLTAAQEAEIEKQIQAQRRLEKEREKVKSQFDSLKPTIQDFGLTGLEKIEREFREKRVILDKAANFGLFKDRMEQARLIANFEIEEARRVAEEKRKLNVQSGSNPGAELVKIATNDPTSATKQGGNLQSLGAGILGQVLQGAEGAQKLVTQSLAQVGEFFLGIPSEISGPILDALSQGPEKVKEMVQGFAQALPEIVGNIAKAIPVLVIEFQRQIPNIIKGFIAQIPEIVQAFIDAMPEIAAGFVTQAPTIAIALIEGIVKNIPKMVEGFAKEFLKIPEQFVKALLEAIPGVGGLFGGGEGGGGGILGDIVGGIGDVFGGIGDIFGLAEGGTTGRNAGLERDGGIVRMGANETVVSSEITDWLRALKNSGAGLGGSQPDIVINIGLQQFARIMFDARKAGYQL